MINNMELIRRSWGRTDASLHLLNHFCERAATLAHLQSLTPPVFLMAPSTHLCIYLIIHPIWPQEHLFHWNSAANLRGKGIQKAAQYICLSPASERCNLAVCGFHIIDGSLWYSTLFWRISVNLAQVQTVKMREMGWLCNTVGHQNEDSCKSLNLIPP